MARSTLSAIRRQMYLAQRTIGDVQAAQRGPVVLIKRLARRRVRRVVLGGLNRRWGI